MDEIAELIVSLNNLFSKSSKLSKESLIILLNSLIDLNCETFINQQFNQSQSTTNNISSSQNPQNPALPSTTAPQGTSSLSPNSIVLILNSNFKPFALEKIEEIINLNLDRIELYWDIIFNHFKFILNNSDAQIRLKSIDILCKIIISAFSYYSNNIHQLNLQSPSEENHVVIDTQIYIQNRLLEALEECSRSSFPDIRQKTLECLNQILQYSGQMISRGWPLILSILMTIAVNNDKPHILFGFNSVSLISTDFLPNLPLGTLILLSLLILQFSLPLSAPSYISSVSLPFLLLPLCFLGIFNFCKFYTVTVYSKSHF